MEIENQEQTAVEAKDETGLAAGFAKARGSETLHPAEEVQEAAPVETPEEQVTPEPEPTPEPTIAGLPESQVRQLLANAAEVAALKQELTGEIRKLHGKIGTLQNPASSPLSHASFAKLRAEYPEVADLIEQDIRSLPAGGVSSDQIGEIINERMTESLTKARDEIERSSQERIAQAMTIARVEAKHDDWDTVRSTPEYKLWLTSKDEAYRQEFLSTWDARKIVTGLDDFKAWRDKTLASTQRKRDRLETAVVTPPRSTAPQRSTLPDTAGLNVGFRRARGAAP